MADIRYDTFDVAVEGGDLRVGRWMTDPHNPVVLAAHGITATHRCWPAIAEALAPDVTFVAPDLRGRGRSADLPGPYSMRRHADDCVRVLDDIGLEDQAVFVGHSMGGFVAIASAHAYPERYRHIVLLDGGPALPIPEGIDVDLVLNAVIGPAMQRLEMTFESLAAYLDYWRIHPALSDEWNAAVEDYLSYDLVGEEPEMRASANIDAVRGDATDSLTGEPPSLKLPVTTTMMRAPRGIMNDEGGLYPLEVVEPMCADAGIPLETLPDVNHYSMLWTDRSVDAIADHVRKVLAG